MNSELSRVDINYLNELIGKKIYVKTKNGDFIGNSVGNELTIISIGNKFIKLAEYKNKGRITLMSIDDISYIREWD